MQNRQTNLMTCSDENFQHFVKSMMRKYNIDLVLAGVVAMTFWWLSATFLNQPMCLFFVGIASFHTFGIIVVFWSAKQFVTHEVPAIIKDRQQYREYFAQFKGKDD